MNTNMETVEVSWHHDFINRTTDIKINRDEPYEKTLYEGALMITHFGEKQPNTCKEIQVMTFEEAMVRFNIII